ncbi:MAG: SusC/RagA family TonB-linked outer membrane protein [Candidatus Cryptobacteroides sp.]
MSKHTIKGRIASVMAAAISFLMSASIGFAQIRVTGTVIDELGYPMIGAGVVEEANPSNGCITDLDGNYAITVPDANSVIVFSFIGYATVNEAVQGRSVINVQLFPDEEVLEATVVTAMGISKSEKSLSYNVQQVELGEIAPTGSFVNSLNGKVAGITINSASTGVGGGSRVVMRGTKSLSGNNNALYVIDGIPMPNLSSEQAEGIYAGAGQSGDGLNSINPDDIESISVLSGPSAAALYGSAAANGVVLITTKKGGKDKLELNYTNSTMFLTAYKMPDFQNTYGATESGSYQSWGDKLPSPSSWNPRSYFRTGINENNSISLSTGTEHNQSYFSMASTNAKGIIPNNDYNRYNFTFRNTSKFLEDKMTLDLSASYSFIQELNMISQGEYSNPVVPVYLFPAGDDWEHIKVYERYNAERNMKTQYWPYANDHNMQNPYWINNRQKFENNKSRFMGSASLKYQLADWISLSARAKLDRNDEAHTHKFNASTYNLFAGNKGYYSNDTNTTQQLYAEFIANINKYFLDNTVNLIATVGANVEDVQYNQSFFGGSLSSVPNLFTYGNIEQAGSKTRFSQSGYHRNKQAVFANVQIGYRSMVYLDLTARNDWSSTLAGSDYKSFFYPTVGLSGIVTELLPELKGDLLNYWKVRLSYSEVGNDPNPFLTIPTYQLISGSPSTTTSMPNTNLQPERTSSWELGTNVYMFDNRLKIDATVYGSSTFNQFFTSAISGASGYTSITVNAGQVDNSGVELSLRWSQDLSEHSNWSSYLTFSHNKNTVVSLLKDWKVPETGEIVSISTLDVGGMTGVKNMLVEGGSMGAVYVRGLLTDEHGAIYVNSQTKAVTVDNSNWIYAGDTAPKANIGWGNDFRYKGFTASILFQARLGGIVISKTQQVLDFYGISQATADARDNGGALVNGFRLPAQAYYQTIGADQGATSMYCYDATNVRLAELSIGYDVPVNKAVSWVKGLNVSLVANNLLLLYCKAPFDPELTANTGTYNQGIDYFMQPSTRNIGFSIKLKL